MNIYKKILRRIKSMTLKAYTDDPCVILKNDLIDDQIFYEKLLWSNDKYLN